MRYIAECMGPSSTKACAQPQQLLCSVTLGNSPKHDVVVIVACEQSILQPRSIYHSDILQRRQKKKKWTKNKCISKRLVTFPEHIPLEKRVKNNPKWDPESVFPTN